MKFTLCKLNFRKGYLQLNTTIFSAIDIGLFQPQMQMGLSIRMPRLKNDLWWITKMLTKWWKLNWPSLKNLKLQKGLFSANNDLLLFSPFWPLLRMRLCLRMPLVGNQKWRNLFCVVKILNIQFGYNWIHFVN